MEFYVKEKVEYYQVDYFNNETLKKYFSEFPKIVIHNLTIIFSKSKSKNFSKAYNLAKLFNAQIDDSKITCSITGTDFYCSYYFRLKKLFSLVLNWKNTSIRLNGKEIFYNDYKTVENFFFSNYYDYLEDNENIRDGIKREDLPYPFVYYPAGYGAFIAFSKDKSEWFLCDCCKEAVLNLKNENISYLSPYNEEIQKKHSWGLSKIISLSDDIKFVPNLCHLCNNKKPTALYGSIYATEFDRQYGWYIAQEQYKRGYITCIPDNLDCKAVSEDISNTVRKKFGYPLIGEKHQGETQLYYEIKDILPEDFIIKRHYRPEWLDGLEIDIYIENLKIGFEYQGQQHYIPVKHWGGKKKLSVQQEHDKRKKEICNNLGIILYEIRYDEKYDKETLKKLLMLKE